MKEWKTYKLSEIGQVIGGATPSTKVASNYDGDIAWITPKDLSLLSGRYIYKGERSITEAGYKSCSCQMLPAGSILFSSRAPIGYIAIAGNDLCTNQGFKSVVPNPEIVNSHFLYYLLSYEKNRIAEMGSGTTFMEISGNVMKNIEVKLPHLSIQNKIAEILTSLDEKIENNQRINDNLEQQAQTLYKSWFVDFEPFKDGKFIESELGQIPEGWQCIPFSMFVSESKAKTGKIGIKEYSVTNNGIFPRDAKYNKSLSQSSTKNKLILYGDLVFGMSRDILNWGVMQEEQGGVSSAYTVYNINSGIVNSTYLELFIKSRIHLFSDLIRPAAREGQGIDKSVLQTKVLLCPPQEVLDTFWPLYNSVTNQIQTTTTEINCLGDVRDTLLPKLMSGELKINEIDC